MGLAWSGQILAAMGILHPRPGPHPVHRLHRVGAAAVGAFLILFAALGLTEGLAWLGTNGTWVLGLSSNGLLSVISLVVGALLVVSATRSGPTASTMSIVLGVAFLLSGMANMLVLNTSLNILAFRLPNIVFSVLIGLLLLVLGSYGRISGGLPADNPYRGTGRATSVLEHVDRDPEVTSALAAAERAFALRHATEDQLRRLLLVHAYRSAEDRYRAWQSSVDPVLAPRGTESEPARVVGPLPARPEVRSEIEFEPMPAAPESAARPLAGVFVATLPLPRRPRTWPRRRGSVAR
jgi:hypothetical protein